MAEPAGAAIELRAGELSATLEAGGLRWIRWRGVEVLRGLELTVRNATWGTLSPRVIRRDVSGAGDEGRIEVAIELGYQLGDIDLAVTAAVSLSPAGELSLEMRGVARRSFERNRIGIICLHPMTVAGRQATFRYPDRQEAAAFPRAIDPRPIATDLVGIDWRPTAGIAASLSLSGERWEMEDQRNWTDASFKTYPTPLRLPYPVHVESGQLIEQVARLSVSGAPRHGPSSPKPADEITVASADRPFPRIESELPPDLPTDGAPTGAIRALGLASLRGLVDAEDPDHSWSPANLVDIAELAATRPVFDLIVPTAPLDRATLEALAKADVVFAFDHARGGVDSSDIAIRSARKSLLQQKQGIQIGGGTRGNFAELNRASFDAELVDAVTYAVTPQVHAFDEASIVETLPVLPVTVRDARHRTRRPISVVLSLRPRFNAAIALGKDRPVHADATRVDPRQDGTFAAAWMLEAIANLSLRGVGAVTVAETHGPAGLVQIDDGSESFRFTPLAALVASLCAATNGRAYAVRKPGDVAAIAIHEADGITLWVANLRPLPRTLRLADRTVVELAHLTPVAVSSLANAWDARRPGRPRSATGFALEPWDVLRMRLA